MHPSTPRTQTLLLFMLCVYCNTAYANTQSTTAGNILIPKTLSSELRQDQLVHLDRQDFDFDRIDGVDDASDAGMIDISSPAWLEEAADTPCFVIMRLAYRLMMG